MFIQCAVEQCMKENVFTPAYTLCYWCQQVDIEADQELIANFPIKRSICT